MPQITIKGNAAGVIKKLQALPDSVTNALAKGLARGLLAAVASAQRDFLSGPRPLLLDVRTGRLRNSVSSKVAVTPDAITGRLGSNVEYAAYHEFGFHSVINVRAHSRITRLFHQSTGATLDLRRRIVDYKGNFVGYRDTHFQSLQRAQAHRKYIGVERGTVRAHQRHVDYAGRPYIRPALEKCLPAITDEINRELRSL